MQNLYRYEYYDSSFDFTLQFKKTYAMIDDSWIGEKEVKIQTHTIFYEECTGEKKASHGFTVKKKDLDKVNEMYGYEMYSFDGDAEEDFLLQIIDIKTKEIAKNERWLDILKGRLKECQAILDRGGA